MLLINALTAHFEAGISNPAVAHPNGEPPFESAKAGPISPN